MITFFITIFTGAMGAFFYRCRGGFIGLGHTSLARLIWWAVPVGTSMLAILLAHGVPVLQAIAAGAVSGGMAYIGLLIPHSDFMDNDPPRADMLGMALVGAARCALIMLPAAPFVHTLFFLPLFGALSGPAYRHAYRFLGGIDSGFEVPAFDIFGFKTIAGKFATCPPEWGEVLTGFVIGAGLGFLGSL